VPDEKKPMIDTERLRLHGPKKPRELLGDGNFGGLYKRPDEEMLALWKVAVEETRDVDVDVDVIEGPWA
jgi:creatinine amidohydrolase